MHRIARMLLSGVIAVGLMLLTLAPTSAAEPAPSPRGLPIDPPAATARLGSEPPYAPYAFLARQRNGAPVAYNRCRAIPVAVNPSNVTPEMQAMIQEVIGRVAQVTGMNIYFAGYTNTSFRSPRPGFRALVNEPIVISFETEASVPMLAGSVMGLGGSSIITTTKKLWRQYVAGRVVVDLDDMLGTYVGSLDEFGNPRLEFVPPTPEKRMALRRIVLLHELGHALGLAHVSDPNQLMYPSANLDITDFAAGDLAGLAILGQQACGPMPKAAKKGKKKRRRR